MQLSTENSWLELLSTVFIFLFEGAKTAKQVNVFLHWDYFRQTVVYVKLERVKTEGSLKIKLAHTLYRYVKLGILPSVELVSYNICCYAQTP